MLVSELNRNENGKIRVWEMNVVSAESASGCQLVVARGGIAPMHADSARIGSVASVHFLLKWWLLIGGRRAKGSVRLPRPGRRHRRRIREHGRRKRPLITARTALCSALASPAST